MAIWPAPRAHMASDGRLDRVEDAMHIDRQRAAHGLGVFDDLTRRKARSRRRRWRREGRAVAEHGASSTMRAMAIAVAHIGDAGIDLGAGGAAGVGDGLEPVRVAAEQDKARALARIGERQRAADAARGAGDENAQRSGEGSGLH